MSLLRTILERIRKNISPRGLTIIATVAISFGVLLLVIPPAWEYSNSPTFCGVTCHTMPPEFTTYLQSPHSRILCVDCHIGRDLILVQLFRKAGHMRLVVDTILDSYELPIHSAEMQPARHTCEMCHTPEKFSNDTLRVINSFENNRTNDPFDIYLVMKTGGGSEREGLGRGIHWHIENQVSYIALDDSEQEIPWVRVETVQGEVKEFNAINSPVDTSNLAQYEIHEMDCMTCHNRIAHFLQPPYRAVDSALSRGDVSTEIPFIRARMIELLSGTYASTEDADEAFASLMDYYESNYPEFFADGEQLVSDAISVAETLYRDSNYPEQLLSWDTHPNNTGHRDSPGCFRCHDGEHVSGDGEVIRLECNLCHSIPQVVRPGDLEANLPISTGVEPASHLDSTWIARHHVEFDATCTNCHTTSNAGGVDDQSFCSNSACHGSAWEYAGFNAPGLAMVLGIYPVQAPPLLEDFEGDPTYAVLQPLFVQQCAACHGPVPSNGLRVTDYASLMAGSDNGAVIAPGDPAQSRIIDVLTGGHFARLTAHQLGLIEQWVALGAPE